MEQMTLFEFMPLGINDLDEAEMVQTIGCALGLEFKYKDKLFGWVFNSKHIDLSLKYSNYSFGDHERYIACGYNYHKKRQIGGRGCPCDTIEKAIEVLREGVETWL